MAQSAQHGHGPDGTDLEALAAADALAPHHLVVFPLLAHDAIGGADHLAHLAAIALQADEGGGPGGDAVDE